MKVLLIDFYDSFTYNISHMLEGLGANVDVVLDGKLDFTSIDSYDAIVLSPGPGLPSEKKDLFSVLNYAVGRKKILGICLGMQGIAQYLGGSLYNMETVKHGVSEKAILSEFSTIFKGCPETIEVGLYHSWAVKIDAIPELNKIAALKNGVVMAVAHSSMPIYGLQFHPESVLTPLGADVLRNFLCEC